MDKPVGTKDVVVPPQRQATTTNSSTTARRPTAAGLGITISKPKFPQYATVSQRLTSFREQLWPIDTPVEVDALVEAGLVFTGVGDSVRCYYCGGGLRNWEDGDDPMVEHAKWYPNCSHVVLVKGKTFITRIADGLEPEPEVDCAPMQRTEPAPLNVLHTPAVQAVLEVGYNQELVLKAVEVYKQQKGLSHCRTPASLSNLTGQDLCRIIIDIEENPDKYSSTPNSSATTSSSNQADGPPTLSEDQEDERDLNSDDLRENERLNEGMTCKLCLIGNADIVFLPCGHMYTCGQCATGKNNCPVCGQKVKGKIKAILTTADAHIRAERQRG